MNGQSKTIALTLAKSIFHYQRYVLVPNVGWGLLAWEADLLALSASGYLYEIEIKISIADLKRDKQKSKWRISDSHYFNLIRGMWFAMPERVWQHQDAPASVPEHAGVILVRDTDRGCKFSGIARRCRPNKNAKQVSEKDKFQLARLGAMRYWSRAEAA